MITRTPYRFPLAHFYSPLCLRTLARHQFLSPLYCVRRTSRSPPVTPPTFHHGLLPGRTPIDSNDFAGYCSISRFKLPSTLERLHGDRTYRCIDHRGSDGEKRREYFKRESFIRITAAVNLKSRRTLIAQQVNKYHLVSD